MEQQEHRDSFSGKGVVTITPFQLNPNGNRTYFLTTRHNMIVEQGRSSLVDLMIGLEQKKLAYIRWGKGGAKQFPDGDPLNPLQVEDKDTDVATFLLDKPLSSYNRLSPTEVEYTETLICDEVNDDVNEAVMLFEHADTQARSIFSRITFPTVRLTVEQGMGIEIRWVFTFAKAEETPVEPDDPAEPVEPDVTPPSDVTAVESTKTNTTVTLDWTPPKDPDFAYVNVFRDGDLVGSQIADTTFTDMGLTASTTYSYSIHAVDETGNQSAGIIQEVVTNA